MLKVIPAQAAHQVEGAPRQVHADGLPVEFAVRGQELQLAAAPQTDAGNDLAHRPRVVVVEVDASACTRLIAVHIELVETHEPVTKAGGPLADPRRQTHAHHRRRHAPAPRWHDPQRRFRRALRAEGQHRAVVEEASLRPRLHRSRSVDIALTRPVRKQFDLLVPGDEVRMDRKAQIGQKRTRAGLVPNIVENAYVLGKGLQVPLAGSRPESTAVVNHQGAAGTMESCQLAKRWPPGCRGPSEGQHPMALESPGRNGVLDVGGRRLAEPGRAVDLREAVAGRNKGPVLVRGRRNVGRAGGGSLRLLVDLHSASIGVGAAPPLSPSGVVVAAAAVAAGHRVACPTAVVLLAGLRLGPLPAAADIAALGPSPTTLCGTGPSLPPGLPPPARGVPSPFRTGHPSITAARATHRARVALPPTRVLNRRTNHS
mmetsp:Transcript_39851/g.124305  ORF Transcript_39851/g.124305 Transcript_39851/m.124305 type:complete len:428 (+) Transcript_39851:233-1516(+)